MKTVKIREIFNRRGLLYGNIILSFFLINGVISRAGYQLDMTRDGLNSLSESSEKVLSQIGDPVLVEAYISRRLPGELLSGIEPLMGILRAMDRQGGNKIQMRFYDPDTEELRRQAEGRAIRGLPIEERKDVEANVRLGYFGLYLQQGEKSAVINLIEGNWFISDLEYRILREIKHFTHADENSGVAFITVPGAGEVRAWTQVSDQNKDNFYGLKTSLEQELGTVEELDLSAPVPASVRTAILTGLPKLEEKQSYYIDQFLVRGGNLICLLKSFDFQMQQSDPRFASLGLTGGSSIGFATISDEDLRNLNQWMGKYGITLKGEVLFEPRQPFAIVDFFRRIPVRILYPAWAIYNRKAGNIVSEHPSLAPVEQLVFPWFSSLELREASQPGLQYEILVQTSGRAVKRLGTSLDYAEVQKIGKSVGDQFVEQQLPVAALAKGKLKSAFSLDEIPPGVDRKLYKEEETADVTTNLAVIATPYILADILLRSDNGAQVFSLNRAFLFNLIEAMEGDTDLLAARSRQRTFATFSFDNPLLERIITWSFVLLLPLILALYGLLRLTRRSRLRGIATKAATEVAENTTVTEAAAVTENTAVTETAAVTENVAVTENAAVDNTTESEPEKR